MAAQGPSATFSPSDHLRLLVDLLKPIGSEIARRWVAAPLLVPDEGRIAVIESIEGEIVRQHASDDPRDADEQA